MDRKLCKTEERNERTGNIDELSTIDMIRLINDEDKKVALAVEWEAERIAAAVDVIAGQLKAGGRLIYCGCGTSGRLGVLDAVECPPTYSTDPDMVVGLIAGGYDAMFRAVEGAPWGRRTCGTSASAGRTCWWASPPPAGPPMCWGPWPTPGAWARP